MFYLLTSYFSFPKTFIFLIIETAWCPEVLSRFPLPLRGQHGAGAWRKTCQLHPRWALLLSLAQCHLIWPNVFTYTFNIFYYYPPFCFMSFYLKHSLRLHLLVKISINVICIITLLSLFYIKILEIPFKSVEYSYLPRACVCVCINPTLKHFSGYSCRTSTNEWSKFHECDTFIM